MSPPWSWKVASEGGSQRIGCAEAIRWLSLSASTVTSCLTQLAWLRAAAGRSARLSESIWFESDSVARSRDSCQPVPV